MKIGTRGKLIFALVAVLSLLAAWQGLRYWWYKAYSVGERTGFLRKLTIKGTPMCKYVEGEMALIGAVPGSVAETWTFSIDGTGQDQPVYKKLEVASRSDKVVTLKYRQDLKSWWRCTPHEYFVTDVLSADPPPAAPPAPVAPAVAPPIVPAKTP